MAQLPPEDLDRELHAADVEMLEQRIMELALEATGAKDGAIFLWDEKEQGLTVDFHMVHGVVVQLPGVVLRHRHDGRPNGIAMWVHDHNDPYLCRDSATDENYATYFEDVRAIAAVPIQFQGQSIGVLSVASHRQDAFHEEHIDQLEALAASCAKFLRRAQLYRASQERGRLFLIKGLSQEWLRVERQIEQVSATAAPVLIMGESGTGKELVAHAIHFNSPRCDAAFVTVNCAAIPEQLLESSLFGHTRGAFTGASRAKIGELRKAHGGTLFLDEVGELQPALQAKVLRAVEYGEVTPVGSDAAPEQVDVRILCATNRNIPAMVREGSFREDLYYRLGTITVELPPLRRYKENLPTVARVFLQQAAAKHQRSVVQITPEAMAMLEAHDYPGNMRELKNTIEHAVIMARGEQVTVADLPSTIHALPAAAQSDSAPQPQPVGTLRALREAVLAPAERRYLTDLLRAHDGNVRKAAAQAGVDPVTLYRLLDKRGLRLSRRLLPDD